ncbi:MAG: ArnT family glycosyltransferase [Anaerolineae bacterium]
MTSPSTHLLSLTSRILFAFAILVFVGYFVIFCVYAFALFRFPYDYDQGEGFELNDSILFARGEWPYKDNETFPFYTSNYGPVFHLLALPLFPIFGPTLTAGRVLSFLATLAIGAIVYRVVQRQTRDRPIAALSGLMVFASNFVYHIGPLFRQHMTMVLFELLAVVAIAGWGSQAPDAQGHVRSRNIVVSMLFLLLAGYTKQLSAATAVAVLAFLFLRAPKKSIVAGLGLAAAAGAIFVGMNAATNGQWFVNSITANANIYDYKQAVDLYGQFFSLHFVIAALAIGYLVYELYWDRLSAYSVWFAFALANAALSGKWGAGESYFTTAVVAACIASGLAIGKIKRKLRSDDSFAPAAQRSGVSRHTRATKVATTILSIAIPLLYLAQAWGVRHLPTDGPIFGPLADVIGVGRGASVYAGYPYFDSIGYTQAGHLPTDADTRKGDRIVEHIRSEFKPALTEEALFALRAGKPVVTNPTQLLNLWNNNAFDPTELIAMIDRQAFGAVVYRAQFYPDPVLQAIGARYEAIDDIWMNGFQYRVLGPRADYGLGCDEARLYAMKHELEQTTRGFIRIVSRDTAPEGWSGAAGVTEFEYVREGEPQEWESRRSPYRLWIAPLDWSGTPPSEGGAQLIGENGCFEFFDFPYRGTEHPWPFMRERVRQLFDIRP